MIRRAFLLIAIITVSACKEGPSGPSGPPTVGFFVTSQRSVTGNLGGLAGADATSQRLATAAGHVGTHLARLSQRRARRDARQSGDARAKTGLAPDRGTTSTCNSSRTTSPSCTRVKATPACLWTSAGSASTGSGPDLRLRSSTTSSRGRTRTGRWSPVRTCADWTSDSTSAIAVVGHSDGMGPESEHRRQPVVVELGA
jgi:hypothetical protein